MIRHRALAAALAALAASAAHAYVPPARAILRRVAQRRSDVAVTAYEVRGTVAFMGESARRAAAAASLPPPAQELALPALLLVKVPGRCRLELAPQGVPAAERPALSQRGGRVSGQHGLDGLPEARALVTTICALLAERGGGGAEPERPLAQALASRGVSLSDVSFGRLNGRVAWVIGGRPQDGRPQAWVDKQSFQPVRLVAAGTAGSSDVRLLDFGSSAGGDAFPRAVEAWLGKELALRFTAEKVTPNPRMPDALF